MKVKSESEVAQSCPTLCDPIWQPTRLPHPWDSPGKNIGVGCHFLLQCMKVKIESEVVQSCLTLQPHRREPTRLPCPWDSLGKNTGVGCHFLLQCMKVKSESEVAQLCPTLRPHDCSLPGSSGHGISQARVLEWGAIAFSDDQPKSILKSRDITLPAKVHLVKAMVFPVVMYEFLRVGL